MWLLLLQSAGKPRGLLHILVTGHCSWDDQQGTLPIQPFCYPPFWLARSVPLWQKEGRLSQKERAGGAAQGSNRAGQGPVSAWKRVIEVPGGQTSPFCLPVLVPRHSDLREPGILATCALSSSWDLQLSSIPLHPTHLRGNLQGNSLEKRARWGMREAEPPPPPLGRIATPLALAPRPGRHWEGWGHGYRQALVGGGSWAEGPGAEGMLGPLGWSAGRSQAAAPPYPARATHV